MRRTVPLVILTVLLWHGVPAGAAPAAVSGDEVQSRASIREAAARFLEHRLAATPGRAEFRIGSLDPRLRLPRCHRTLEAFLPPGGRLAGHTSIGVRCPGDRPWKLYVPARIRLFQTVVIAKGYLPRGTRLTRRNLDRAEREVTAQGYGYMTDIGQALGMITKQPVQDGRAITPGLLGRPTLVRRGEEVTIVSQAEGYEIRVKGTALANGARGDRIRVKNISSHRVIEGSVVDRGLVRVL